MCAHITKHKNMIDVKIKFEMLTLSSFVKIKIKEIFSNGSPGVYSMYTKLMCVI